MSQVFDEEGIVSPVTLIEAGPITVTGLRTKEKDGYKAVLVGYGKIAKKNLNKAQSGYYKELGEFRYAREFKSDNTEDFKRGDKINLSIFKVGDKIQVSSVSKGKGFQGVVKRHHFKGGPRTHGQKHSEREPGSIGGGLRTRVPKGMRMAGRMGGEKVTVKNLKIVGVDEKEGLLYVRGALPGVKNSLVEIIG